MRIRSISVEGFGRFSDLNLGPLDAPVAVFYGPNEAGKSTLLEFVRRVLYGFPDRRTRSNPYPALAGGRYGGSLSVKTTSGEAFTITRTSGRGSGPVTLTSEDGMSLPESELARLLGHHSRDVFETVFAFTLDELHSDELLRDETVNAQIYSAAMGTSALPAAMKALDDRKRQLFLRGGSRNAIAPRVKSIGDVDASLRELAGNAAEYARFTDQLGQVDRRLSCLTDRRESLQSRYDAHQRLLTAWDDWNELHSIDEELAELKEVSHLPADALNRLEMLEERVRAAGQELTSAEESFEEARVLAANLDAVEDSILDFSGQVKNLELERAAFDSSVKSLPQRENELAAHTKALSETLRDLGPDWDESKLSGFDLALAAREEISAQQQDIRTAEESLAVCRSTVSNSESALEVARVDEQEAIERVQEAERPKREAEEVMDRRNLLRAADSRLRDLSSSKARLDILMAQAGGAEGPRSGGGTTLNLWVIAAIALAGLATVVAGVILAGSALPLGIIVGLLMIGIALYFFVAGQASGAEGGDGSSGRSLRALVDRAQDELTEIDEDVKNLESELGLASMDARALLQEESVLDVEQQLLDNWTRLSEAVYDAQQRSARLHSALKDSRKAMAEAEAKLESARERWRGWLRQRALRDTFMPETIVELRGKVEIGHGQLDRIRDDRGRIEAIQRNVDRYVGYVEAVAPSVGIRYDRADLNTVAIAAERLIELKKEVEDLAGERKISLDELEKARRLEERRRKSWVGCTGELDEFVRSAGAPDADQLRELCRLSDRRAQLEEARRTALSRLQRLSGPGDRLDALLDNLRSIDLQMIEDDVRRAREERDSVQEEIEAVSGRKGEIRESLRGIEGEEMSSMLRLERNRHKEDIRSHAREWAKLVIAEGLLDEARRKFERERQPDVVRHAESYFRKMTNERYRQVYSPVGQPGISVTDSRGRTLEPSELSRGTREQLFLSLRFGLISDMRQRAETLPVIVDEVLVNFDPERALRAASAFVRLAKDNQVLVFTCHPNTVELFEQAAADAGVQTPEVVNL